MEIIKMLILLYAICLAILSVVAAVGIMAAQRQRIRELERENRRLKKLIKKDLMMENDYMEACAAMFHEAGRKSTDRKGDENKNSRY